MPRQDFIDQLKMLNYEVEHYAANRIGFTYTIPVGKFNGQQIKLGFVIEEDFPMNPPSGPHISPRLLPLNSDSKEHPCGGIHESNDFGADWQYWSRPYPDWNNTDRTVKSYMAHIRRLFDQ